MDEIIFNEVDYEGIMNYLVKERSFSEDRIQSTLNRLKKALEKKSQNLDQVVLIHDYEIFSLITSPNSI